MASRTRIAPEADVVLLSFPIHFTWEFLQAPLFRSMEPLSHFEGIRICLRATLGDMAMVLVAFWVTCIVTGTRRWHVRPEAWAIAVWLVSGLLMTVISANSVGQQDALASDEGLAQTEAGPVQETALLPDGM